MLFCENRYFDLRQILKQLHVANVALRLRYRHNDPKSLESLIELLENYLELSMKLICKFLKLSFLMCTSLRV